PVDDAMIVKRGDGLREGGRDGEGGIEVQAALTDELVEGAPDEVLQDEREPPLDLRKAKDLDHERGVDIPANQVFVTEPRELAGAREFAPRELDHDRRAIGVPVAPVEDMCVSGVEEIGQGVLGMALHGRRSPPSTRVRLPRICSSA